MTQEVAWGPASDEGVRLFNARRFFEAHDVLEEIWLGTVGAERLYYQGLIQLAVGFHKLATRNLGGARSQLRRGLDKLERTGSLHSPIDTGRLVAETREVLARLEGRGPSGGGEALDLESLPHIHDRAVAGPPGAA